MTSPYCFTGDITAAQVAALAAHARPYTVASEARDRLHRSYLRAEKLRQQTPVYGLTTGVGANKATPATTSDHGINLLRSHAAALGPYASVNDVRAMLIVRINQLLQGGSGIDPAIVEGMVALLDADALPTIRTWSGVGTADLSALATVGLALAGERPLNRPSGFRPIHVPANSALPLMSSSALSIGRIAVLLHHLRLVEAAQLATFALTMTAVKGNMSPLSPAAAQAIGIAQAARVATHVRDLIAKASPWQSPTIQDAYGLRAFLPSFSVWAQAIDRVEALTTTLINQAQENPLFTHESVVHHGAFLMAPLAHEVSSLIDSMAQVGNLTLSRITMINDSRVSGQPRFLSEEQHGSSGDLIVEYNAGAALARIHSAQTTLPSLSVVLSNGMEETGSSLDTVVDSLAGALEGMIALVGCEFYQDGLAIPADAPGIGSTLNALVGVAPARGVLSADKDLQDDLECAVNAIPRLGELTVKYLGGTACRA